MTSPFHWKVFRNHREYPTLLGFRCVPQSPPRTSISPSVDPFHPTTGDAEGTTSFLFLTCNYSPLKCNPQLEICTRLSIPNPSEEERSDSSESPQDTVRYCHAVRAPAAYARRLADSLVSRTVAAIAQCAHQYRPPAPPACASAIFQYFCGLRF